MNHVVVVVVVPFVVVVLVVLLMPVVPLLLLCSFLCLLLFVGCAMVSVTSSMTGVSFLWDREREGKILISLSLLTHSRPLPPGMRNYT